MLARKDAFLYLPESVDYFLSRKEVCSKMESLGYHHKVILIILLVLQQFILGKNNEKAKNASPNCDGFNYDDLGHYFCYDQGCSK